MFIAKNDRGEYLNVDHMEYKTLYKWSDIPMVFHGEGEIDFIISQRGWLTLNTFYTILPVKIP